MVKVELTDLWKIELLTMWKRVNILFKTCQQHRLEYHYNIVQKYFTKIPHTETKNLSNNVDISTDTKKIPLVRQNSSKKKFCNNFSTFMSKSFQIWDHFCPLHFPKDSENLKSVDIWLWEVGTKRHLNGVNKWKKSIKKTFFGAAILNPLWAKVFKSETTTFHYFSLRILKI